MAQVRVKDKSGAEHTVDAYTDRPLMETLRDTDMGVLGTCGGQCSCGTCHVYVDAAWVDKLPAKSEDEAAMLEAIGELVEVRPSSRLSCQIPMEDSLDGLAVEVAPIP